VLFVDIDHTGCHHFPYLLNVVCKNEFTHCCMACGRVLINRQDGISIGNALSELECNVRSQHKDYKIGEKHKSCLTLMMLRPMVLCKHLERKSPTLYVDAQFYFLRSALRVAKLVKYAKFFRTLYICLYCKTNTR